MPTKRTGSTSRAAAREKLSNSVNRGHTAIERIAYNYENGLSRKGAEPGRYSPKINYDREMGREIAGNIAQDAVYMKTGKYPTRAEAKRILGKKK